MNSTFVFTLHISLTVRSHPTRLKRYGGPSVRRTSSQKQICGAKSLPHSHSKFAFDACQKIEVWFLWCTLYIHTSCTVLRWPLKNLKFSINPGSVYWSGAFLPGAARRLPIRSVFTWCSVMLWPSSQTELWPMLFILHGKKRLSNVVANHPEPHQLFSLQRQE